MVDVAVVKPKSTQNVQSLHENVQFCPGWEVSDFNVVKSNEQLKKEISRCSS